MPEIELKKIQPNRLNPRLEFGKVGLDELADSMKQVGMVEPLLVRPRGDGYEVVVGERRYRAAHQAGLDKVPVIIRDYTDDEVMELNLIENIQREDLSDVEKGNVVKILMERFPEKYPTQDALAHKLGVDPSRISQVLSTVEKVPIEVQKMIAPAEPTTGKIPKGKISGDMAVTIARRIKDEKTQVELAKEISRRGVTKPMARKIITRIAREPKKPVREIFKETVTEAPAFLPFSRAHADSILKGQKTQTSRKGIDPKIKSGAVVRAAITHFADLEVTNVTRKKLRDFDEGDAEREGGYTLEEFKRVWRNLHGEWNPDETVYVIQFRLTRVV